MKCGSQSNLTALVASIMLGPRLGRWEIKGTPPMGSPTNALVGLFMLWWGWLAFNSGSTFGVTGNKWRLAAKEWSCFVIKKIFFLVWLSPFDCLYYFRSFLPSSGLIHLVFWQTREYSSRPRTMAQTVSPRRSLLDQGASSTHVLSLMTLQFYD